MLRRTLSAIALCATATVASACETALVLAIDVSSSVDPGEYRLQVDGLADALLDPEVAFALENGKVRLSVLQWSGAGEQQVSIPWTEMATSLDIAAYSAAVRAMPRAFVNSNTAPGNAIVKAVEMLDEVPMCSRHILDVSGDGNANAGTETRAASRRAERGGVIINGIAIESIGVSITQFYRKAVITQYGFVVTARRHEDYPRAIREKLRRELTKVTG